MLINARSPDWNLLMGPIWWRTGYLISSKCCNSNNKNTFALLHELRMHHVHCATIVTQNLAAVQLRNKFGFSMVFDRLFAQRRDK